MISCFLHTKIKRINAQKCVCTFAYYVEDVLKRLFDISFHVSDDRFLHLFMKWFRREARGFTMAYGLIIETTGGTFIPTRSNLECASHCLETDDCASFDFIPGNLTCQIGRSISVRLPWAISHRYPAMTARVLGCTTYCVINLKHKIILDILILWQTFYALDIIICDLQMDRDSKVHVAYGRYSLYTLALMGVTLGFNPSVKILRTLPRCAWGLPSS